MRVTIIVPAAGVKKLKEEVLIVWITIPMSPESLDYLVYSFNLTAGDMERCMSNNPLGMGIQKVVKPHQMSRNMAVLRSIAFFPGRMPIRRGFAVSHLLMLRRFAAAFWSATAHHLLSWCCSENGFLNESSRIFSVAEAFL